MAYDVDGRYYPDLGTMGPIKMDEAIRYVDPLKSIVEEPKEPRGKTQAEKVAALIREIADDPDLQDGIVAMQERKREFNSLLAASLAGIAIFPYSRRRFNEGLDEMWLEAGEGDLSYITGATRPPEVIIGGGLHAAIYCAVRVAQGHKRPLVIEAADAAGGVFNISANPSFYLNSRNRPGRLTIPGRGDGGLNVLPGAPVQPCDLNGDEYQRNSDLAFAIRATLGMNAKVITGRKVVGALYMGYSGFSLELEDGTRLDAKRVIDATGLGDVEGVFNHGGRVLSYLDFMGRMDETFPLRDMGSVAVIGAGDSGKTVIEALTGQGPAMGWSVAGIDYPERIDWYGVPSDRATKADWDACNRSRYKGIARLLPVAYDRESRVTPLVDRAEVVRQGYECGFVNERPYDLVIDCTGFRQSQSLMGGYAYDYYRSQSGGRILGMKINGINYDWYRIGVGARIEVEDIERRAIPALDAVPENATSLFRYASRTADLAASLR